MLQSMGLQRVGHDRATELNCMVKNSNSEKLSVFEHVFTTSND